MAIAGTPLAAQGAGGGCPPQGWTPAALASLRGTGWVVRDSTQREQLALSLLACLASSDPTLRDATAFDALSTWMRGDQLSAAAVREIGGRLLPVITSPDTGGPGFVGPFSALVLSEVARVDRLHGILSATDRRALLSAGLKYLPSVRDYRGYDERDGWRHGVAHGSDLLMQLTLNPKLERDDLLPVLAAVGSQVAPTGAHFYVYGEGERLARPVFFLLARGMVTDSEWGAWLRDLSGPGRIGSWETALATQEGLARRHNLRQFLLALLLDLSEDAIGKQRPALGDAVSKALESIHS